MMAGDVDLSSHPASNRFIERSRPVSGGQRAEPHFWRYPHPEFCARQLVHAGRLYRLYVDPEIGG